MYDLWNKLVELDTKDPAVSRYLEWLSQILPKPYVPKERLFSLQAVPYWVGEYIVLDAPVFELTPSLPAENSKVKMGHILLPYGIGIILTAYQNNDGKIEIVIHNTVLNTTEFFDLFILSSAFPPGGGALSSGSLFTRMEPLDGPMYYPAWKRWSFVPKVYWILWRITFDGRSALWANETLRVPVEAVHLLLEMPLFGAEIDRGDNLGSVPLMPHIAKSLGMRHLNYSSNLEYSYLLISHAAFALASYFTDINPQEVALAMGVYGTIYVGPVSMSEPIAHRILGGSNCEGYSFVTSNIASILGVPAAVVKAPYPDMGHVVSGIVFPSRYSTELLGFYPLKPRYDLYYDIDFDGIDDKFEVIYDTAFTPENALRELVIGIDTPIPPLLPNTITSNPVWEVGTMYSVLSGIPQTVLTYPNWLKTPYLLEYENITRMWIDKFTDNYHILTMEYHKNYFEHMHVTIGYQYDFLMHELIPLDKPTWWVEYVPEAHLIVAEVGIRNVLAHKGFGAERFTPPSQAYFEEVLTKIPLIYKHNEKVSMREHARKLAELAGFTRWILINRIVMDDKEIYPRDAFWWNR